MFPKQLICCLLVSFALRGFGATGDITRISVSNEWAYVDVEGFSTNSAFNNGFLNVTNVSGTNEIWIQVPSSTNGLELVVSTPGYKNGVLTTNSIKIYGTEIIRKPYPDTNWNDVVDGASARIRVALTKHIFTNDTLTANIHTNGFKDGATFCNGGSSLTVTNESTLAHPSVIPWWTDSGWTKVTGTVMRAHAMAAHDSGIDSCAIIARTAAVTVSNHLTRTAPDYSRATKGLRWAEYFKDIDMSSFTSGDEVRVDYIFRPRRGDAGSVFDTRDNLYQGHTAFPASITNLYDPDNTLTPYIAVVALTGGATPTATNTTPANVSSVHYFSNTATASLAMLQSNSYAGGIVYVKTDQTNWSQATVTYAQTAKSHVIFEPYPGDTFSIRKYTSGTQNTAGRTKIRNATIAIGGTETILSNAGRVVAEDCVFDSTGSAPVRNSTVFHIENSRFIQYTGDLKPFSGTEDLDFVLIGNDLGTLRDPWFVRVGVGNALTNSTSTNFTIQFSAVSQVKASRWQVLYNNWLTMYGDSSSLGTIGGFGGFTNLALIQNVIEGVKADAGNGKQLSTIPCSTNNLNVLLHNNTWLGVRLLYNYAFTNNPSETHLVSLKNNAMDVSGWVSDPENAVRDGTAIGNWSQRWNVGAIGNALPNTTFLTQVLHWQAEYFHFNSYYRPDGADRKPVAWFRHVRRGALADVDPASGGGDYNYLSDAPVFHIPTEQLYAYDLALLPRGRIDPPGALAGGNVQKGGFF